MNAATRVQLHNGSQMPIIGLGTWQMGDNAASIIAKAIGLGYRMIDTSGDYGTQPAVGEGLQVSGIDRKEIYIVTKVEEDEDAYQAARTNVEEMGLSYADLILIHRPPTSSAGQHLWRGLMRAREEGIAKDIGVSNYSIEEIHELVSDTGEIPTVNQIEWSPFGHSEDILEYCRRNEIIIQAYSPLTREKRTHDKQLKQMAEGYGKSVEQLMLRWCIQLGTVPIPKASSMPHLKENLDIFDFQINGDDMATINGMNEQFSALSTLQYI